MFESMIFHFSEGGICSETPERFPRHPWNPSKPEVLFMTGPPPKKNIYTEQKNTGKKKPQGLGMNAWMDIGSLKWKLKTCEV